MVNPAVEEQGHEFAEPQPSAGVDPHCPALLLAVARQPEPSDKETLSRHVANIRDWNCLIRLAEEHRMLPMLYTRLMEAAVALPPAVEQRLQRDYMRNGLLCLANAAELIAVLGALDQLSIPAVPFKGVVLAASVYGNLSARAAGDLDILIHRRHRVQALAAIRARGYELLTPVNADETPALPQWYEYHLERPSDGIVLELCWRLEMQHPRYERDLELEWIWPHRRQAKLAGADVPDISPEILLLILCMHGCKHVWSRLIWICDVARLLASSPNLDWTTVLREAKHTGLERPLALGVLLAHQVGSVSAPETILRRFEADRVASSLAADVITRLFSSPGADLGRLILYDARLVGFRNLIRYFLSLDFLRRHERDRVVQYVLRHLRILRDRSAW